MALLSYSVIASLDGYVVDNDGRFDWAAPDAEVHAFVNDQERDVGTYLYGRRMYEVMAVWQDLPTDSGDPAMADYATIWKAGDKVVYSTTLTGVTTPRTTLEPAFDPDAIRQLKQTSARSLSIGGPGLAAHALRAGLVDEVHWYVTPVVVGGGTSWLPDDLRLDLELLDEHRFTGGVVHLHYRSA